MKTAGEFITRHRHLLLIALLTVTLLVSSDANRRRLEDEAVVTSIPVTQTADTASIAVATYVSERDAAYQQDIATLTALLSQDGIGERAQQDAADQLQAMIRRREARDAIEEILASTDLAPCAAVITGDAMTLVTAKSVPSAEDSALVLTLAAAHADIAPEKVHIITAE